jgi:hypothetical protein
MDDLEGKHDVKPHQRVEQFMRLREVIEDQASRKFFDEPVGVDQPVVLRSDDFSIVAALRRPHPEIKGDKTDHIALHKGRILKRAR